MAYIINEDRPGIVHKEGHKCFQGNSFLEGFFSLSNFCPLCGEPLTVKKMITMRKCSECGEDLVMPDFDYRYCPNCGAKFGDKVKE